MLTLTRRRHSKSVQHCKLFFTYNSASTTKPFTSGASEIWSPEQEAMTAPTFPCASRTTFQHHRSTSTVYQPSEKKDVNERGRILRSPKKLMTEISSIQEPLEMEHIASFCLVPWSSSSLTHWTRSASPQLHSYIWSVTRSLMQTLSSLSCAKGSSCDLVTLGSDNAQRVAKHQWQEIPKLTGAEGAYSLMSPNSRTSMLQPTTFFERCM